MDLALPCLKPMFTWNSFDIPDPTTTLALVFSYMASTIFISDSGAPIHLRVVIAICLGTVSKAFSRSTKAKAMCSCFSNLFSTSCLSENIPSVVPRPFLKLSCSSPNSGSTLNDWLCRSYFASLLDSLSSVCISLHYILGSDRLLERSVIHTRGSPRWYWPTIVSKRPNLAE